MVIDGSHFDEPTPTPNAPSGPIARTKTTEYPNIIALNKNTEFIFESIAISTDNRIQDVIMIIR